MRVFRRVRRRVYKITMAVMRSYNRECRSFDDGVRAGRRWRRFRPIWNPVIILRAGFFRYPFDLITTKSRMPDNRPFPGQALQINQSIFADWAGLPSAVADFDFCAVRLGNDLWIRWKSNH